MAISEIVKTAVSVYKAQLKASYLSKGLELERLQVAGTSIIAARAKLRETYEALEADIAEPTVSEEPV